MHHKQKRCAMHHKQKRCAMHHKVVQSVTKYVFLFFLRDGNGNFSYVTTSIFVQPTSLDKLTQSHNASQSCTMHHKVRFLSFLRDENGNFTYVATKIFAQLFH
jgi:hypothetical protein